MALARGNSPVVRFGGRCPRSSAHGFTLIELIAVIVVLSIMAATAAPVLANMQRGREAALAREAERRVELAAGTALSTTLPTGVTFSLADQTMVIVEIQTSGAAPTAIDGVIGATFGERRVSSIFPGTAITDVDLEDSGIAETIWFDYKGSPQTRDVNGANPVALTRDAVVTFSGGHTLTIREVTGLIERSSP